MKEEDKQLRAFLRIFLAGCSPTPHCPAPRQGCKHCKKKKKMFLKCSVAPFKGCLESKRLRTAGIGNRVEGKQL